MQHPLVVIIYDGIHNSVFDGQVLHPLIAHRQQCPDQLIHLISFEKQPANKFLTTKNKLAQHNIELQVLKKIPLISTWSLWPAIWQLKKILKNFTRYELKIRGPLAGYIALHAVQKNKCKNITIQARGLAAQEYSYGMQTTKNAFIYTWHNHKLKLLRKIENFVYHDAQKKHHNLIIEAVSPALKEYLINQYKTPVDKITIAQHDIPVHITPAQKTIWRTTIRKQLNITLSTHVYCYNGSMKPWQCPQEVIKFFKQEYTKDTNSFLLILTQDIAAFKILAKQHELLPNSYHITTIPHQKMYEYLSACDTGIMFREKHIVNWVARPTKILEYQAVGLKIVHNNTVGYLVVRSTHPSKLI